MKKKYIAPSMMAIRVNTMTILAASGITGTNVDGLGAGGGTSEGGVSTGNSRRGSFWDEEE